MKKWVLLALWAGAFSAFGMSAAEDLQGRLNAMQSMKASFKQVVKSGKKMVSQSSGTMALKRPGRFRWQTIEPMEQLIVADGNRMWIYDVDLEQVTVKKQGKGIGGTAALFLSGYDDTVSKNFEVTDKKLGKQQQFFLKSKSGKDNFQKVEMIFAGNMLQHLKLYDQMGQVTDVRLLKGNNNAKLDAGLFAFKPPKGVDVVEQ